MDTMYLVRLLQSYTHSTAIFGRSVIRVFAVEMEFSSGKLCLFTQNSELAPAVSGLEFGKVKAAVQIRHRRLMQAQV